MSASNGLCVSGQEERRDIGGKENEEEFAGVAQSQLKPRDRAIWDLGFANFPCDVKRNAMLEMKCAHILRGDDYGLSEKKIT